MEKAVTQKFFEDLKNRGVIIDSQSQIKDILAIDFDKIKDIVQPFEIYDLNQLINFVLSVLSPLDDSATAKDIGRSRISNRAIGIHVLDRIKSDHIEPFTHGKQGEIYKVEINFNGVNKNYVVAKKRLSDINGIPASHEYDNQLLAYTISNGKEFVKVPEPLLYIKEGEDEYIIMEYVDGKTLYCMMLERLISNVFIQLAKKDPNYNNMSDSLNDFIKRYSKSVEVFSQNTIFSKHIAECVISFENDTEAEMATLELIQLINMYSQNKFKETDPKKILEYFFRDMINSDKLGLFNKEDALFISTVLKSFISRLHSEGIYHRDLGGNPRNIMFAGDGSIYVIDYGTSKIDKNGDQKTIYYSSFDDGVYDDDKSIITAYIDRLIKPIILENLNDKISILDDNFLDNIGEKFGIDKMSKYKDDYKNFSKGGYTRFKRAIDDYIVGKNTSYGSNGERFINLSDVKNSALLYCIYSILFLNNNELLILKGYIRELLLSKKNSKKYKFAIFFNEMIQKIESTQNN